MFVKGLNEGNLLEIVAIELAKRGDVEQIMFFDAFAKELLSEGKYRAEVQLASVINQLRKKTKELLFQNWDV